VTAQNRNIHLEEERKKLLLSRTASDMNKGTPVMIINATPTKRPRREITGDLRNGLPPHPETQQNANRRSPGFQLACQRHDMKCLINGKHPLRLL